jgi:hypothetical protein
VNYFSAAGRDNGPLHAPATASGSGNGNGVYRSNVSGFPIQSYQGSNYWVDVVFNTTTAPDTTAPTVMGVSPANGATGVAVNTAVTVTFVEDMSPATISTSTIELRSAANALVAATVSYNSSTRVATLTPSAALTPASTYTVRVLGGATDPRVKDVAGNALATTFTSTFTTANSTFACPCSLWSTSTTPTGTIDDETIGVELGVKFRSDVDGFVTALRFYKPAGTVNSHVGHLWTSTGTLLATVTFTGETASGWQQASLTAPLAITANTTYVVSYFASDGRYLASDTYFSAAGRDNGPLHAPATGAGGGNGVYLSNVSGFPTQNYLGSNYWVDVVFSP